MLARVNGIDVTHFQGTINWSNVRAAGYEFAYEKATEAVGVLDSALATNMAGGSAAGLLMGAFHYAKPDTSANDAVNEANYFVAQAGNYMKGGWLRPAVQVDTGSTLGKTALSSWVNTFVNTVQSATGVTPLVYATTDYATNYLDSSVANKNLWVANYNFLATQAQGSSSPPTGSWGSSASSWGVWRYSASGTVSGVAGSTTNLDVFNGDRTALQALVIPPPNSSFQLNLDFGPAGSAVPAGYVGVASQLYGSLGGYAMGWSSSGVTTAVRTGGTASDDRYRTYAMPALGGASRSFEVAVPNGSYTVRVVTGSPDQYPNAQKVIVEGTTAVNASSTSASAPFVSGTVTVNVTDGKLTLASDFNGAANTRIDFVDIVAAARTNAPPAAPSSVAATASGSTSVAVGWHDNADNDGSGPTTFGSATWGEVNRGFTIKRQTLSGGTWGAWTTIAYALSNATSYADATVAAGVTYKYSVLAMNGTGLSSEIESNVVTTPSVALSLLRGTMAEGDADATRWIEVNAITTGVSTWSIDWGDGSARETYASTVTTAKHRYLDGSQDYAVYGYASDARSNAVTAHVTNVAPAISIDGGPETYEGDKYNISFAATDPGRDTISSWLIDWGDGTTSPLTADETGGWHIYDSAAVTPNPNVTVSAYDEDGGPYASRSIAITVLDRPPTVLLSGKSVAAVGDAFQIGVAITDVGGVTVHDLTINWGDGQTDHFNGAITAASHHYAAAGRYVVGGTAADAAGTYPLDPTSVDVRQTTSGVVTTATAVGGSRVAVQWSGVSGSASYQVAVSNDGTTFANVGTASGDSEGHLLVEGLLPDTTYSFKVTATASGTATVSNLATTKTLNSSIVYQNDFEGATGNEWSTPAMQDITPASHTRFLGQFGNATENLNLGALPGGQFVTVQFDLYLIRTWDGSDVLHRWGPDFWRWGINGAYSIETTFTNHQYAAYQSANDRQDYPQAVGTGGTAVGVNAAFTGSLQNSLGLNAPYGWLGYWFNQGKAFTAHPGWTKTDSVYRMTQTVKSSDLANGNLSLLFGARGLQGLTDESWGLDNVVITTRTTDPTIGMPPTLTVAADSAAARLRLSWTDVPSEYGFNIYRGTSADSLSLLTPVSQSVLSYIDGNVSAGPTYYYALAPLGSDGAELSRSNIKSGTLASVVQPTLTVAGASAANEGSAYALTWSISGLGDRTISNWKIDWGDGAIDDALAATSRSANHVYADGPGTFVPLVYAIVGGEPILGSGPSVSVANVPPTAGLTGPISGNAGDAFAYSTTATDPSLADRATLAFAWSVLRNGSTFASGTSSDGSFSFTPDAAGVYSVIVIARDKDGGVGQSNALTVNVTLGATVLTASANSATQHIDLSWNDVAGAQGFRIYRGSSVGTLTLLKDVASGTTSYADAEVTAGQRFYYAVAPFTIDGSIGARSEIKSAMLSDPVSGGTISGTVWNDRNQNGVHDDRLIAGVAPTLVVAIDSAGGSTSGFGGVSVGSPAIKNHVDDFLDNLVLDAEVSATLTMVEQLIEEGFGATANVSIVDYGGGDAEKIDFNPQLPGNQFVTHPLTDANGDGVSDLEYALRNLPSYVGAYDMDMDAALHAINEIVAAQQVVPGSGTVLFLNDSGQESYAASFDQAVTSLRDPALELTVRAFGVGTFADMPRLLMIDPGAVEAVNTDEMFATLTAYASALVVEPGLEGRRVFADLNGNGSYDADEPSDLTAEDGSYQISNLAPGTYSISESLPSGWSRMAPESGLFIVTLSVGQSATYVDFGDSNSTNEDPLVLEQQANHIPRFAPHHFQPSSTMVGYQFRWDIGKAFVDPDGDRLSFEADPLNPMPAGMTLNEHSGVLSWTSAFTENVSLQLLHIHYLVTDGHPGGTYYGDLGLAILPRPLGVKASLEVSTGAIHEDEDDEATVTVSVDDVEGITDPITVNLEWSDFWDPSASTSDYTVSGQAGSQRPSSVTFMPPAGGFGAGRQSTAFTVKAVHDTIVEPEEYVTVGINPGSQYTDGAPVSQTFAIVNDNTSPTVVRRAIATPKYPTGTTSVIRVLADDDDGEASLTYTWSLQQDTTDFGIANHVVNDPAAVSFSDNGTNSSKNVTATFSRAGTYQLHVTISDGITAPTESLAVVFVRPKLTSIAVTPNSPRVALGGQKQLSVIEKDQFGDPMDDATPVAWTVVDGGGTISSTGVYTAPASGTSATIRASAGLISTLTSVTFAPAGANEAPVVTAVSASASPVGGTAVTINATATDDGAESSLIYSWAIVAGPAGAPDPIFSATGTNAAKSTLVTFKRAGTYTFRAIASDGRLSGSRDIVIVVNAVAASVTVTPPIAGITNGKTRVFTASVLDQFGNAITGQPITWEADGNGTINASTGVFTASSAGSGSGTAIVTAMAGGLSGSAAVATNDATASAPSVGVVTINGAASGVPKIDGPADVVGYVDDPDDDLASWNLILRPTTGGDDIVLASGSGSDSERGAAGTGVLLGTIRPTLLTRGIYKVLITASDAAGHTVNLSGNANTVGVREVEIDSELRLGNLTLPVTDLSIATPAGMPLTISRFYDSNRANENRHDFGPGWRWEQYDLDVQTTARLDPTDRTRNANITNPGAGSFYATPPAGLDPLNPHGTTTDGDIVSFTLPGGERHVFRIEADLESEGEPSGFGATLTRVTALRFVPVNGVHSKLTVPLDLESTSLYIDVTTGQFYTLDSNTGFAKGYNPTVTIGGTGNQYFLTTQQGLTYDIVASTGKIRTVTDLNGNQIDYTGNSGGAMFVQYRTGGAPGSLGTATGLGLKVMYGSGGIDWIEDVEGHRFDYDYDENNDLATATDRQPNGGSPDTTTYAYSDESHLLTQITDARGVDLLHATYTDGELTSLVNAKNKTVPLSTAPGVQAKTTVQTSEDLAGNRVESVFDSAGNLVRDIHQLQDPLNSSVTRYSVTVREYTSDNQLYRESVPFFADAGDRFTKPAAVWSVTRTYTANGNVATETDALGRVTTYGTYFTFTDPSPAPMNLDHPGRIEFLGKVNSVTDWLNETTSYHYEPQVGNLLWSDNANGERTRLEYDARGRVTKTFRDNKNTSLTDDVLVSSSTYNGPFGRLDASTSFNSTAAGDSATTYYLYDGNGNAEVTYHVWVDPTDPTSKRTVVDRSDYDDDDRVVRVRRYDLAGDVSALLTSAGYAAYLDGQTAMATDTSTTYDSVGQAVATTDEYGRDALYDYDPRGNLIRTVYADGTEVRAAYDDMGRVVWRTDRYFTGATSLAVPNATTDAAMKARATFTTYDGLGRAVATRRFDGIWIQIAAATVAGLHDSAVAAPPALTAALSLSQTIYDAAGRVATSIGADEQPTSYTYFDDGQVRTVTDALNHTTTYSPRRPDDASTPYDDSLADRVTDANNHTTITSYDVLGRTTKVTYADDSFAETAYTYVLTGDTVTSYRQRKASDAQVATTNAYDLAGRLTQVTQPDPDGASGPATAPVWEYGYDAWGDEVTQADPNEHTTTFAYDEQGRRVGRTLPMGEGESESYDTHGRLQRSLDFKGNTTVYVYYESGKDAGRLRYKRFFTPTQSLTTTPTQEVEYTYDALGRSSAVIERSNGAAVQTTAYGYDAEGRVTLETLRDDAAGTYLKILRSTYDEQTGRHVATWTATNLTTATTLASARTSARTLTEYGYDALGRLRTTTLSRVNGTTVSQTTTNAYDDVGNLDTVTQANGVVEDYGYDTLDRLTSVTATKGGTTLFSQAYILASDGQRQSASEMNDGASSTVTWTYDGLDRLTGETRTGANAGTTTWTLDAAGNRLTETKGGVTKHSRYDADDRLTGVDLNDDGDTTDAGEATYTYDANGSTTQVATAGGATVKNLWDVRNRLVAVDGNGDDLTIAADGSSSGTVNDASDATYRYTDAGDRVAKTVGTTTTFLLIDGHNPTGYTQVLEESGTANGTPSTTYTLGMDVLGQTSGVGTSQSMIVDGLGSVRGLASSTGASTASYDYDAFGNALGFDAGAAATHLLFAGEYWDAEKGNSFNRARSYDPTTGRFLSFDSFEADPSSPASLNKYLYGHHNPVYFVDPTGHDAFGNVLAAIGMASILIGTWLPTITVALGYTALAFIGIYAVTSPLAYFEASGKLPSGTLFRDANDLASRSAEACLVAFTLAGTASELIPPARPLTSPTRPLSASDLEADAAAASKRLGFYLSDIVKSGGNAVIPIDTTQTLRRSDLELVKSYLQLSGTTSVTFNTGPVVKDRIENALQGGKTALLFGQGATLEPLGKINPLIPDANVYNITIQLPPPP